MASSSHPLSIFREYILLLNDFPSEIINPNIPRFDFILGFASEKGTGQFVPTWNVAGLSPQRVRDLKKKHPNVRVVISIGDVSSEFNPTRPEGEWIPTAVGSIKDIIKQYENQIDGIDIHYDVIRSSEGDFAHYIGEVIRQLRNDRELSIKVVSIAPIENVQGHFLALYSNNRDNIDWVDYRFYNQNFSTVDQFVNYFNNEVVAAYDAAGKVLPGISISPRDLIIFEGIRYLICNNLVPGVFVWNADKSAVAPIPFSLERELQNL